jgi:hypothetical protein
MCPKPDIQSKPISEDEMTLKSQMAVLGLVLSLGLGFAQAATAKCPAESTSMTDIIASLNEAKACDAAMKVFEACEYTASGDVAFGEVVEKKCEADFLGRANASKKRAYERELGACDRKYRNQSGTMYRSFTAFCRALVAQRYSRQALEVKR